MYNYNKLPQMSPRGAIQGTFIFTAPTGYCLKTHSFKFSISAYLSCQYKIEVIEIER